MKPQRAQRKTLCTQKEFPSKDIAGKIISYAIEMHSKLGLGLLESVYEEALTHEFKLKDILFESAQRGGEIKFL